MKFNQLPNDGYISDTLSKDLFENLLKEALECENNEKLFTGIDSGLTCPHYQVSEMNTYNLQSFLGPYIEQYDNVYYHLKNIKVLSKDRPYVFQEPWFNVQRPNTHLPCHYHDGVLSYTIWLKLPSKSQFTFIYSLITGKTISHYIHLTPNDVGKFIMFPSTLDHIVYPYESDPSLNEIRISLSGNILYKG